jgi:hypothetical protein
MLRWRRLFVVVVDGRSGGNCEIADNVCELESFSVVDVCLKRGGKFWGELVVELPVWLSRDVGDDGDCWVEQKINGVGCSTDGGSGGDG